MSVINLVDLAGSEKVGKTGASGDRLKEGINLLCFYFFLVFKKYNNYYYFLLYNIFIY